MSPWLPTRLCSPLLGLGLFTACALAAGCSVSASSHAAPHTPMAAQTGTPQPAQPAPAAPVAKVSANPTPSTATAPHAKPQSHVSGEHLAEWMKAHNKLTPQQQQQALEKEPGFHDLPPATQQHLRERLAQLNSMPPAKREHLLENNEAMERLTVQQRAEVRSAMQQLNALPPDDRRYVARTFRGLRELNPSQRKNVLNSDRFAHLNDAQRAALNHLLEVEPLLPPPYDETATHAGVAPGH